MSICCPDMKSHSVTLQNEVKQIKAGTQHDFLTMLAGRLRTFLERKALYRQRKIDRAAFLTMMSLDDSMLDDIGLTRNDIIWAAKLPLSVDAALAVREQRGDVTCSGAD